MTHKKPLAEENNHKNSNATGWLWLSISMSVMALVSATLGGLFAVSMTSKPLMRTQLNPEQVAVFDNNRISGEVLQISELTRPVNILVMGMSVLPTDIQNPPEETKNIGYLPQVNSFDGLSDVILLLRLDPQKKKIAILSIPRDTRVHIEGYGIEKINAANAKGGPALSAKSVSELLEGVKIDRYIRINVLGVGKLIDAIGGVTVYVPEDMKYQDDSQHLYINLKEGYQHLGGDQALQLLRYRKELGDIGRIQRQQMVLEALIEQSLNPAIVMRLPQLLNVIQSHIDTNLTVEELIALVGFGVQTDSSDIEMVTLPGRFSARGEFNSSYWMPDYESISNIMSLYFDIQPADAVQVFDKSIL